MRKSLFFFLLMSSLFLHVACDDESIEVGSEVFGEDSFGFDKYQVSSFDAKNINTGVVGTRNLIKNILGTYNSTVFGSTAASIVTQIGTTEGALSSIGNNPVLDSVYVYVPYTSSVVSTDNAGVSTYKLSEVYGEGTFTLNVYENGYYLRTQDPLNNFDSQQYYSDQKSNFDTNKKGLNGIGRLNNSSDVSQNVQFKASAEPVVLYKYKADGTPQLDAQGNKIVKERLKPGIWLDLDKSYFQSKFFTSKAYQNIQNNSQLREFFRGLYFEAVSNNQNHVMQLDLTNASMVFVYKQDGTTQGQRVRKTIEFDMGFSTIDEKGRTNVTVNLIESQKSDAYTTALSGNSSNLWIKGNEGSLAELTLMSDDELAQLKQNNWLINQAVLTIYADSDAMSGEGNYPERLYLYDLTNNQPIIDYTIDLTSSPVKSTYNGILDTSESGAYKYRFAITNHLNNLIQKDSTNVKLGLVAVSDLQSVLFTDLKNKSMKPIKIPVITASHPFGVVLKSPKSTEDKKMKLDIYYTQKK